MTAQQIQFGPVTFIPGDKEARFPYCNSLYIAEAGIIIDPSSNRRILVDLYRSNRIDTVCLTHWHEDHFRFLYLLDGCPLWISKADAVPMADCEIFLDWYGLNSPEHLPLRNVVAKKMASEIQFKPRRPDRILTNGEIVDLGSITMEVIASPGHSPGHLSFYFPESSILFLGDYNLDAFGPWTGDPYSDIDQCIDSINRLRQVPAEILIAGHDPEPIRSGIEKRWDQYLNAIYVREEKLAAFLHHPRSLDDILDQWLILGKPKEPIAYFRQGERAHVEKHLARMLKRGTVHVSEGFYQRT